jgi:hypothetical protein
MLEICTVVEPDVNADLYRLALEAISSWPRGDAVWDQVTLFAERTLACPDGEVTARVLELCVNAERADYAFASALYLLIGWPEGFEEARP